MTRSVRDQVAGGLWLTFIILATPALADGDSINMRLDGADAFETRQMCVDTDGLSYPCGALATTALHAILRMPGVLTCQRTGWSYDRPIMRCMVGTMDVSCELIRQGWAVVDPRYSHRCQPQQDEAKQAARGVWAGAFTFPWLWRHGS